jgi:excisionase family DNA binding protein
VNQDRQPLTVPPELSPDALEWLIAAGLRRVDQLGGVAPVFTGLPAFRASLRAAARGGRPKILPVQVPREYLTTNQAAEVMAISERRVRELAQNGTIIARKRGRDWFIDPDAARDYHRRGI